MASAADAKGLSAAAVQPGVAVNAALHPTRQVAYAAQPEKPGGSVAHGGLLGFTISEAGTYRVALGSGAWIDVLKNGEAIDSSDHGHGPACSSIRKVVSFALQPGAYVLQISANAGDRVGVLITRAP
ncbi:MAG: homogentisate 1,2-dioxygenase [Alphaproteobacteria bacterium]|nr:homogentisate 1,2-dioxygenase [Alphaproteobacteria bacterium]